jgi:hypothetical protein
VLAVTAMVLALSALAHTGPICTAERAKAEARIKRLFIETSPLNRWVAKACLIFKIAQLLICLFAYLLVHAMIQSFQALRQFKAKKL